MHGSICFLFFGTSIAIADNVHVSSQLYVKKDEPCRVLCSIELDAKTTNMFIDRIKDDYTIHM